jgi:hypothetical protein
MRCIPDENAGPHSPCKVGHPAVGLASDANNPQRCKSGGHECIYEESNRGKRSTRKNEALTAKIAKMEAALKGVGAVSRNGFSNELQLMAPRL